MGNVIDLFAHPREIAMYFRVGHNEHNKYEHLLSTGKLSADRYVVEAGNFKYQGGLVHRLREKGAEIVLDTNAAELSVLGRYSGAVKSAPWAADGRPLEPEDFVPNTNRSIIKTIARFAVETNVNSIMSPAHYIGDDQTHWISVDLDACIALRGALDNINGKRISIDYPLILTYAQLRDREFRQRIISLLKDIPFDYLWLRISGFGADATGSGIERCIQGLRDFHALKKPVIVDQAGGLAALALCACGAASGFSHGIEGKERFSAYGWLKPNSRGGGHGKRVYIEGLDRRLEIAEVDKLFNDRKNARTVLGCRDPDCCSDTRSMLKNPESHFVSQKQAQVRNLSKTPESFRTEHFLNEYLVLARQTAEQAKRLNFSDGAINKKIMEASKRLDRVEEVLTNLLDRPNAYAFAEEARIRESR